MLSDVGIQINNGYATMPPDVTKVIAAARRVVVEHGIDVRSLEPTATLDLKELWVVRFPLDVPEGVVQCPDEVIVQVDKTTGVATLFESL